MTSCNSISINTAPMIWEPSDLTSCILILYQPRYQSVTKGIILIIDPALRENPTPSSRLVRFRSPTNVFTFRYIDVHIYTDSSVKPEHQVQTITYDLLVGTPNVSIVGQGLYPRSYLPRLYRRLRRNGFRRITWLVTSRDPKKLRFIRYQRYGSHVSVPVLLRHNSTKVSFSLIIYESNIYIL